MKEPIALDQEFWRKYADETCRNLQESNTALQAQLVETEKHATKQMWELSETINGLNSKVHELEAKLAEREKEVADALEENDLLRGDVGSLRTQRNEMKAALQKAEALLKRVRYEEPHFTTTLIDAYFAARDKEGR